MSEFLALTGLAGIIATVVLKKRFKNDKSKRFSIAVLTMGSLLLIVGGILVTPQKVNEIDDYYDYKPLITKEEVVSLLERTQQEIDDSDFDMVSVTIFQGEEIYLREILINQRDSEPIELIAPDKR